MHAHGTVILSPGGKCVVDLGGGYLFNMEAHPIDPTIVYMMMCG